MMLIRHHLWLAVGVVFLSSLSLAVAERSSLYSDNGETAVVVHARAAVLHHDLGKSVASKTAVHQDRDVEVETREGGNMSKSVHKARVKVSSALKQSEEATMQVSSATGEHTDMAETKTRKEYEITYIGFTGPIGVSYTKATGYIEGVYPGGEAAEVGVQVGWQILKVNDAYYNEKVFVKTVTDCKRAGTTFKLTFFIPDFFTVDITGGPGVSYTLATGYVEGVDKGGQAWDAGVERGYRIMKLDGNAYSNELFVKKVTESKKTGQPYKITFRRPEWGRTLGPFTGKLGVIHTPETGYIEYVEDGGAAHRAGVKVGWQMQTLDNFIYSEKGLEKRTASGKPFYIGFFAETWHGCWTQTHQDHCLTKCMQDGFVGNMCFPRIVSRVSEDRVFRESLWCCVKVSDDTTEVPL